MLHRYPVLENKTVKKIKKTPPQIHHIFLWIWLIIKGRTFKEEFGVNLCVLKDVSG
jgi:hypothetical protein